MNEKDEELYKRYLERRKEEDFRILFLRHREELLLFLYGYVHSLEDAEELMMDAFVAVAVGRSPFLGRSSFRTWLFSVGKKLAMMHLRKEKRHLSQEKPELFPETETFEWELVKKEQNRELYQAMNELSMDYRQVLFLIYFEEMTPEEAGRVMGKSRKQIYNLISRAKQALKEKLERTGFKDA